MTIPALLFAFLFAFLYGALYHLIRGGGFPRMLLYLGLSAAGFAMGHLVGLWRGWTLIPIGSINLGLSSIGSLIILVIGDWLSHLEARQENKL